MKTALAVLMLLSSSALAQTTIWNPGPGYWLPDAGGNNPPSPTFPIFVPGLVIGDSGIQTSFPAASVAPNSCVDGGTCQYSGLSVAGTSIPQTLPNSCFDGGTCQFSALSVNGTSIPQTLPNSCFDGGTCQFSALSVNGTSIPQTLPNSCPDGGGCAYANLAIGTLGASGLVDLDGGLNVNGVAITGASIGYFDAGAAISLTTIAGSVATALANTTYTTNLGYTFSAVPICNCNLPAHSNTVYECSPTTSQITVAQDQGNTLVVTFVCVGPS